MGDHQDRDGFFTRPGKEAPGVPAQGEQPHQSTVEEVIRQQQRRDGMVRSLFGGQGNPLQKGRGFRPSP